MLKSDLRVNKDVKEPAKISKLDRGRILLRDLEIGKEIGEGAQGTVYHAKWNGMDVAFKKVRLLGTSRDELSRELSVWQYETHCI